MVEKEKEMLYNQIVAAAATNCIIASERTNKLIFMDLNEKTFEGKIMIEAASIAKTYNNNLELYVCMDLWEYIKFRFRYKGIKFKRIGAPSQFDMPIFINTICNFMAKEFEAPMSIYEEIYNEFYLPENLRIEE